METPCHPICGGEYPLSKSTVFHYASIYRFISIWMHCNYIGVSNHSCRLLICSPSTISIQITCHQTQIDIYLKIVSCETYAKLPTASAWHFSSSLFIRLLKMNVLLIGIDPSNYVNYIVLFHLLGRPSLI